MELNELTFERAKALEGTLFQVEAPDGTSLPMRLDEVLPFETPQRRRRAAEPARKREPFSLYFVGPVDPVLPQAMYTFRSEALTLKTMFIVPIAQNADGTDYEAVFT
jgi:hypothetical protein